MSPEQLIAENRQLAATVEQLTAENKQLRQQLDALKWQLDQMKKTLFGARNERSHPQPPGQLSLFEDDEATQEQPPDQKSEVKSHQRSKPRKKHPGRAPLPEHLPVEEIVLEPEEDTTGMILIGKERSEHIEFEPASLWRVVIIRPKYLRPDGRIVIAPLPDRPLEKSVAGPGLLAHLEVEKFVCHQPFYRQIKRFSRQYGWNLQASTLDGWHKGVCALLTPLYEELKRQMLACGYLQVDESPIRVLSGEKKGKSHQGYQWVHYSPEKGLVWFRYRRGRGLHGPREVLSDFSGYVQCDGYRVYDKLASALSQIELVGCWVHARRKFYEARDSHPQEAAHALAFWRELYAHEEKCRHMDAEQRHAYRQAHHVPLIEKFRKWVSQQRQDTLPKSPLGRALHYFEQQWPKLEKVFSNGRLELDNNLIENKIRPLALGRKNYLFAGSHSGAQRIAMMYSFFGTCLANEVDPFTWLRDVLERIATHPVNRLDELLPPKWKQAAQLDTPKPAALAETPAE